MDHLSADELAGLGLSGREVRELLDKLQHRPLPDFELDLSEMRDAEDFESRMKQAVPGEFE